MKHFFITFFLLLGIFLTTAAQAVVLSSIYADQITVPSRSTAIQKTAMAHALKNVFIKASGNTKIATIPAIADAIKHPDKYVRNFSYNENNEDNSITLHVDFSSDAVNNLLNQLGQPMWGKNRPLILVWFATQNQAAPQLLNTNDNESIKILNNSTKHRGLPIILPILDLTDLQTIQPADVWAPFINVIRKASLRYSPDAILIIRLDQSNPNNLISHWALLSQDKQFTWDVKSNDEKTILQTGVDDVTELLAKQFSVTKSEQSSNDITITITNLKNVDDYAKIFHYLNELSGVTNVEVQNVSADQAKFILTLNVDIKTLRRTLKLNSKLSNITPDNNSDDDNKTLETNLIYKLN